MFQCVDGYSPTEAMNTTCTSDGSWLPNPTETMCVLIKDKGTLVIVIVGDWYIIVYVSWYTKCCI